MPFRFSVFVKILLLDCLFIALLIVTDILIRVNKLDNNLVVNYIYASVVAALLMAFAQVFLMARYFFRKDNRRGFFYLLHFVLWLALAYFTLGIHFLLLVGAHSAGEPSRY